MNPSDKQRPKTASRLEDDIRAIIVDGDTDLLIKQAQQIGQALKNAGLSMAQIRGVFGTVRQIEMRWTEKEAEDEKTREEMRKRAMRKLLLLQPKLEYQARRQGAVEGLRDVLIPAIKQVQGNRQRFGRFVEFFEAILAYHVAAGGKTS